MKRMSYFLSWSVSIVLVAQPLCLASSINRNLAGRNERLTSAPRVRKPIRRNPAQAPVELSGQTTTPFPGGDSVLIGGEGSDGPQSTVLIKDGSTGEARASGTRLNQARAWHTATMLPNGHVLVLGGIGSNGEVVKDAELFDPDTRTFQQIKQTGLIPRAYHSATLLTDGRVLVAGGLSARGRAVTKAELWDHKTNTVISTEARLSAVRQKHSAALLSDGNVLIERGRDETQNEVTTSELFNAEAATFSFTSASSTPGEGDRGYLAASLPVNGQSNVPVDSLVALRFSKQIPHKLINRATIRLVESDGTVQAKIIPAENGRLAFIVPLEPLKNATSYTLTANIPSDSGSTIVSASVAFTTVEAKKRDWPELRTADTDWTPNAENLKGDWRGNFEKSAFESLAPLQAPAGETAIAGQVLALRGLALADVTIAINGSTTRTDSTGRFLLTSVAAGHQVMVVDGRSANRPGTAYGTFRVGVEIIQGQTNVLTYTIWMPKLDMAHAVSITSPTTKAEVITNPKIPGLELHLPPGTLIRGIDGQPVTQISITPVPTDRPPFPLPPGFKVPVFASIQPGGAQVIPPRARLIYPNYANARPGARIDFWNYDPEVRGWHVYGQGTVTPNGRQVIPDPGVSIYEFSGIMISSGGSPPIFGPEFGDDDWDGDPVDLSTGLFVYDKTDLLVTDVLPISVKRTYRQGDGASRSFGIGSAHLYDMFLWSVNNYQETDLILPDGGRIHYVRISPGTGYGDAVYEHTTTPGAFYKSRIRHNGVGWDLIFRDGTVFIFPEFSPLSAIRDRYGNQISVFRSGANITQVLSPNGRWIQFSYDSNNRVTQAKDNIGRAVGYTYDAGGRLWKVTDTNNGLTEYTYDSSGRMLTVKDARGIVYLTNEYDTNSRIIKQTLADDSPAITTDNPTYHFVYTTGAGGKVVQTDVTDPRGKIRRVTFSSTGYVLSDTAAWGTPEQQVVTFERQPGTNFLLAVIDPMNRRLEYVYNPAGNLISITELADTPAAATTNLTYHPAFNQVATVRDPLNRTTTYDYDIKGNLISVTDPLDHQTTFEHNHQGQITSITDPLDNTSQFVYDSGDLVKVIDPLDRSLSFFTDAVGRLVSVVDSSGSKTRYEYDPLNQVKKVIEQLGGVTEFTYDPNGNVLTIKDARNQTTTFTYDNMDRMLTYTDSLQGASSVESYEYDLNGNPTKVTDRRGKVTTFDYDGLNRATFVGYGTTAGPTYESTVNYTYDGYNRVTGVLDSSSGTITINFDDLARTASETTPHGTVGYSYDIAGRLISKTVSGQAAISYNYDNANRLLSISQGLSSVSFSYDNANRPSTMTLPNGIVMEYGYDDASQLTAITYKNGGTTIGDLAYEYDKSGRRTKVSGTYARTGLPQALGSTAHNAANQLTQRGATTLTYDANGNLTNDGVNTYTWDARNQLSSITGSVNASFQYDAFGRRVSKTVGGVTTDYLYDGDNVVQEKVGSTPSANLLNGGIDEVFSRAEAGGTQSFISDGLGSTLALLNSTGVAQTEYSYEPFGNTTFSGAPSSNPTQYTGRENDGTGLYYYRSRYYSPKLQRFISEDSVTFAGGDTNLYAYVSNNPCNLTDPSGQWLVGACVGGAAFSIAFDLLSGRKPTPGSMVWGCVSGMLYGFAGRALLGPILKALKGINTGKNVVYVSRNAAGEVNYVGITNNLPRRIGEHARSVRALDIKAIPGLQNLSRADARAVEQILIERFGLARAGGTLLNIRNSISPNNPIYNTAIQRGREIVGQIGGGP
jgi:RHS repeat-associated protein